MVSVAGGRKVQLVCPQIKPCVVSLFLKILLEAVDFVHVTCGGLEGCWEGVSSAALFQSSRKMLFVSPT